MKKTILITALLLLLTGVIFAQNTDKDTKLRSEQYMTYEAFEATMDAFRQTFVPGYTFLTVTIDSGTAVSDSLDLGDNRIIGFVPDSAWTTATLTFLTWNSITSEWVNIIDDGGTSISYTFTDSTYTAAKPTQLAGVKYLKVRSGTPSTPVKQNYSDKRVGIILRRY